MADFLDVAPTEQPEAQQPAAAAPEPAQPPVEPTSAQEPAAAAPAEPLILGKYRTPDDLAKGYTEQQRFVSKLQARNKVLEEQLKSNEIDPTSDDDRIQSEIEENLRYISEMRFENLKNEVLAQFPGFNMAENMDAIENELVMYDPAIRRTDPKGVLTRVIKAVINDKGLPGNIQRTAPVQRAPQSEGASAGSGPSAPKDMFDEMIEIGKEARAI